MNFPSLFSDFTPSLKDEEEEDNEFDFKNLIDIEQKKKESKHQNQIESDRNTIMLKEYYFFRINNIDYKFYFNEREGKTFLTYYKLDDQDDAIVKTSINLGDLRDYLILQDEQISDYKVTIRLRYLDSSKSPLEFNCYNREDFVKFIAKLEVYVKKGKN